MYKYIVKRILLMIPTLIGGAILVFFLLRLIPGVAISLAVFGFNLFGDALRDALDPKLRALTR